MQWKIHHRQATVSTNLDARSGNAWDVFTADFQSAGRGRLNHRWLSPAGANLLLSAVLDVAGLFPENLATLPLVVGLAVLSSVRDILRPETFLMSLKWPNDVLVNGRKVAGILCERVGDNVIAGIGVNVKRQQFDPELAHRAISLGDCAVECGRPEPAVDDLRDLLLEHLGRFFVRFSKEGFASVYPEIAAVDWLKGRSISIRQTDDDAEPIVGLCGGIQHDGSLLVAGRSIYAGEAHVL